MTDPILVVDDHPAVRMAVRHLLAIEGMEVVAEADNGADALRLLETHQPCTVILDLGMPGIDGLSVINRIVARKLAVKIIVLTGQEATHMATRCMQSGAHGFVNKQSDLGELVNAVKAVQANYNFFPMHPPCAQLDLNENDEQTLLNRLTTREIRVLLQLVEGLKNKEIAKRMMLSDKTISTYKVRLLNKLRVATVMDLFILAKRNGLI
ncbi:response regulator [Pseudomonas sp. L1(2025)]|uniref:response regulator n=1 Tax=Pseudomonas sp. L1(2025) TaxID=3449429 RepID=UPI003F68E13D